MKVSLIQEKRGKQGMALPARTVKSGGGALKYGALSSLIPASVWLILELLDFPLRYQEQTLAYITNIVPSVPLIPVEVGTYGSALTNLTTLIFLCYQGSIFALVVAVAASVSGRWAMAQTRKMRTALGQGAWIGCGFGLLATLTDITFFFIQGGGSSLAVSFNDILANRYGGFLTSYLLYFLVYYFIFYLIFSLLAIGLGILGGWLGCLVYKSPRKSSPTPVATSAQTN
jgi:hypothetical protein